MSATIQDTFDALRRFQPTPWEGIPDLGLYMDQVITFLSRMYQPVFGDDTGSYLSAPMINNYVKAKLIPRPTGKKYSREQIALLSIIIALKQVAGMEDIRRLLTLRDGEGVEDLYNSFCDMFSRGMLDLYPSEDCGQTALEFAIRAASYHAGLSALLRVNFPQT